MRAREFMVPGVLYIRSLRSERTLFYLQGPDSDWTQYLIELREGECSHPEFSRWKECAESPNFTTISGAAGTILPATDDDIREMFRKWLPRRHGGWRWMSIAMFLHEIQRRPGMTPDIIKRLTDLAWRDAFFA